jgi:D-serine deaminase-like pyridoxal phosphate-dependent protein
VQETKKILKMPKSPTMTSQLINAKTFLHKTIKKIKLYCHSYKMIHNAANENKPFMVFIDTDEALEDNGFINNNSETFRPYKIRKNLLEAARYVKSNGALVYAVSQETHRENKKREEKAFTNIYYCNNLNEKLLYIKTMLKMDRRIVVLLYLQVPMLFVNV